MTVAPTMPIARYRAAGSLSTRGLGKNPWSTSPSSGRESSNCTAKQAKISVSNATTKASSGRWPRPIRTSTSSASATQSNAPQASGRPNSSFRAMAVPITSARSQAMIAVSQASHSRRQVLGE